MPDDPYTSPPPEPAENLIEWEAVIEGAAYWDTLDLSAALRSATAPEEPAAGPALGKERHVALDVLRGVAVFGILFVNIESFSMVTAARRNPIFGGGVSEADDAIWLWTMLLADTKFIALFSMLFGAGTVIMCSRWAQSDRVPILLYYRRMIVLAVMGLAHGFFLWDGDILFFYAVYGCTLYPLRYLPGTLLMLLGLAAIYAKGHYFGWPRLSETFGAGGFELRILTADWATQFDWRKEETYYTYKYGVKQFALQGIGFMMVGMGLLKLRVFTGERSRWLYPFLAVAGFAVGIPAIGYFTEWCENFDGYRGAVFVFGSLLVTGGWIGVAVALARFAPGFFLTKGLANAGRMALTNYLLQTIICTTIFYGHGFGKFGDVSRQEQLYIVLGICAFETVFSTVWLRFFRFGPFEWVWRMLTYLRYQPFRRTKKPKRPAYAGL